MARDRQTRVSAANDFAWRMLYRLGFAAATRWWGLTQPRHEGALVAVYVGTSLLLIRNSYRRDWSLPGGGVRRGEKPRAAARRELAEEVGLRAGELGPAEVVCGIWDGRRDRVHVFELRLAELPPLELDGREVVAARLFAPDELPALPLTGPLAAYLARSEARPSSPPR